MLSLEPIPIISLDLDKGKGIVFGYEKKIEGKGMEITKDTVEKLLQGAMSLGIANSYKPLIDGKHSDGTVQLPMSFMSGNFQGLRRFQDLVILSSRKCVKTIFLRFCS